MNVTVWNEYRCEREDERVARLYPNGLHEEIAAAVREATPAEVRTATLDEPENGLPEALLEQTDVLVWWAHRAHREVDPEVVQRVAQRVREGMGYVVLHSSHFAEPFIELMGTSCRLAGWNEEAGPERVWVIHPEHPLAEGLPSTFVFPETEMYAEPFEVPPCDEVVAVSSFTDGNVFRCVCAWRCGEGRVVYIRPDHGHKTYPLYRNENVRRLVGNAVRWLSASRS